MTLLPRPLPETDSTPASAAATEQVNTLAVAGAAAQSGLVASGLLEALRDAVSYGVVVLDAHERVILWSRWLERASGISRQAAQSRKLMEIFPELAGGRVQGAIESALQDGFPSVLSQTLNKSPFPLFGKLLPNGLKQRIQQKVNVLPLGRALCEPCCLIEIFDVSLAVHREKTIEEQKKFLNTILDSEPECVMVLAADGSTIQINQAGLALFEVKSLAELGSQSLLNFVLPSHREAFSEMLRRVLAGENANFEFNVQGSHGTRCWIDTKATPLRNASGAVVSLLAVARDTTARRQAEATTRALIDATQESAMLLDPAGVVLATNEIAAQRLGTSSKDLLGQNFFALLPPDLASSRQHLVHQVFSTGQPGFLQDVRDGFHFESNLYPVFDSAGKVVSIAVYAADVTERLQRAAVDRLFHQIDQQILHGQSKQHLFNFICTEVARIFDFAFSWIGRKNADASLSISAWGGDQNSYFSEIVAVGLRWDNTPLGQGPSGRAVRSGQTQWARATDAEFAPWCEAASQHDLHSFHSIPLILLGEVFGCFTAVSSRTDTFDNPVITSYLADIASRICVTQERANDHEQLRLLQTGLATAANGVFITDKSGRIQWLNAAFLAMTGYSEKEAMGATPGMLKMGRTDAGLFEGLIASLGDGPAWSGETTELHKDGSEYVVRQTITPIRDAAGETSHFISILEDVTAIRAAEAKLEQLAHYDLLTNLPNRILFGDYLRQAIALARRNGESLALMFIDLDKFKQVNDSHGHDVGDLLLQQVAVRLKSCVRESDRVARLAGDEFTILLPSVTGYADATVVAEKLTTTFVESFPFADFQIQSGVSIGIALFPEHANSDATLLKCADAAMYAAKRSGRNSYRLFQPQMINEL